MAVITKATAKSYFNTGDKPTEAQFGDVMDSIYHGVIDVVRDHGAKGDGDGAGGGTNDRAAIRAAFDEAEATTKPTTVFFPPRIYRCDTGWGSLDMSYLNLEGGPAQIDFTNLSSGSAMTLSTAVSSGLSQRVMNGIQKFDFLGPGKTAGVDLFLIDNSLTEDPAHIVMRDMRAISWQDIVESGTGAHAITWDHCAFRDSTRGLVQVTSGGQYFFSHFIFRDVDTAFFITTSGDIYVNQGQINNGQVVEMTTGRLYLDQVHVESHTVAWPKVPFHISGASTQGCILKMRGGSIQSSQTETVDYVFQNDAPVDENAIIDIEDVFMGNVVPASGYLGGGTGNIKMRGTINASNSVNQKMLGQVSNALFAGSFENDAIEDFIAVERGQVGATITDRLIGSNLTLSADTAAVRVNTFDGTTDVSTANDEITITAHGYVTGRPVTYNNGGNTSLGGLTSGTTLLFVIRKDDNTISLATTVANAWLGTKIDITSTQSGTHEIRSGNRGLLLTVTGNPATCVVGIRIQPGERIMGEIWIKSVTGTANKVRFRYVKMVIDEDGAADILAETADLHDSAGVDTSWTRRQMQNRIPAPAWATHAIWKIVAGPDQPSNVYVDDIMFNRM